LSFLNHNSTQKQRINFLNKSKNGILLPDQPSGANYGLKTRSLDPKNGTRAGYD
jgi:hypothetical protein